MIEKKDNYVLQAQQAKQAFLTYDQQMLIDKFSLNANDTFLYLRYVGQSYRIHRRTASLERLLDGNWVDGNSFGEVMTLLDILCDSRMDRFLTGRWKNMQAFGLQFHSKMLEEAPSPFAQTIQRNPEGFRKACLSLGGIPEKGGDMAYSIEFLDGLRVCITFWAEDEDFPPSIRWFWDENANMYIRYETMHFAIGFLAQRITEYMQ